MIGSIVTHTNFNFEKACKFKVGYQKRVDHIKMCESKKLSYQPSISAAADDEYQPTTSKQLNIEKCYFVDL